MTKIQRMRASLSGESLAALGMIRSSRIGAPVSLRSLAVMTELRREGVVAANDGLTIVGSALAAQLQQETEDALF